ncbi:hypothetical protein [Shinella zoogloeoides]|uniref:hypothetical protein n=1 Tax=Shinella zoogloeoides TaxID=352475 RepID=UPI00273E1C83|nr:hypothetical protein [Shinella zoogloeoides]WLR90884.1 hypothetical protein Q9316_00475 [Shinella zoogloeoides]
MKPEEWEALARKERLLRCRYEQALRDIKAEAYGREAVPADSRPKEAMRGTALALTGRLSQIERISCEALSPPRTATTAIEPSGGDHG